LSARIGLRLRFQEVVPVCVGKVGIRLPFALFLCVDLLSWVPCEAHAGTVELVSVRVVEDLAFLGGLFAWGHGLAQGFESGVEAVQGGVEVVCAGGVVGVYGEPDDLRPEVEKLF
jgi:hypothetical protein